MLLAEPQGHSWTSSPDVSLAQRMKIAVPWMVKKFRNAWQHKQSFTLRCVHKRAKRNVELLGTAKHAQVIRCLSRENSDAMWRWKKTYTRKCCRPQPFFALFYCISSMYIRIFNFGQKFYLGGCYLKCFQKNISVVIFRISVYELKRWLENIFTVLYKFLKNSSSCTQNPINSIFFLVLTFIIFSDSCYLLY